MNYLQWKRNGITSRTKDDNIIELQKSQKKIECSRFISVAAKPHSSEKVTIDSSRVSPTPHLSNINSSLESVIFATDQNMLTLLHTSNAKLGQFDEHLDHEHELF